MQDCTHLSRFALVSRVFPGRCAKKYTGYCIIACVPMCVRTPVIIQFGVSDLHTGVGARWVQIVLCKPSAPVKKFSKYIQLEVDKKNLFDKMTAMTGFTK